MLDDETREDATEDSKTEVTDDLKSPPNSKNCCVSCRTSFSYFYLYFFQTKGKEAIMVLKVEVTGKGRGRSNQTFQKRLVAQTGS